jgi:hypothetical protein
MTLDPELGKELKNQLLTIVLAGPIGVESPPRRSKESDPTPYWPDAFGEPIGVPVQLCLPGLSQTGAGILWQHDHHLG